MPARSILESPGARQFAEESTTVVGGVEGGEQLATTTDESVATPGAMVRAVGSSEAEAEVTDAMLESRAERPVVLEE